MQIDRTAQVTTFMAECFWPGVTECDVVDIAERVRHTTPAVGSGGAFASYLGAVLVPSDEIALCIFDATSINAVTDVSRQAAIPFERILEIVRLGSP